VDATLSINNSIITNYVAVGNRKRAFHFWSPGGVRRRHAAALSWSPLAATAATAADAVVYSYNLLIKNLLSNYELTWKSVTVRLWIILSPICVRRLTD